MPEENKKLEFLKREEIRTMEKDIRKLREIEAEKERERISFLGKKVEKVEVKEPTEIQPEEALIPKPPERPSLAKKILIRLAILFLALFLLSSLYWIFRPEKLPTLPEEELPPKEEPEEKIFEKPEIPVPPSLISIETTRTFEVSENEESLAYFNQLMKEELPTGSFTRVVVKNVKESKVLGLKEFSEVLEIKVPENFYQKLENDFTLFIYSQEEGKRIGFITKIKEKEGLEKLLKSWEPTMEEDFENFFKIMAKTGTALMPYFKNASYLGTSFRYQTFSIPHFGICYSISDQYFIFTSSGKSIMKIIKQLTIK